MKPPGPAQEDRPPAACVRVGDSAGPARLETLKKRSGFLACARAQKVPTRAFVLQARHRDPDETPDTAIRVGYTASKKVGNAVARNRAKRRLRALARAVIAAQGRPGWDYVLVARRDATNSHPFDEMQADLSRALARVHRPQTRS